MTNQSDAERLKQIIRDAGGIVHSDGNIFFTSAEKFQLAAIAATPTKPAHPVGAADGFGPDKAGCCGVTVTKRCDGCPHSTRPVAEQRADLPLQDAKDVRRLSFMASRPPRYIESSKNGLYRVYQDHAAESDKYALWVAMTLDYYVSATGAIDAAIASQKGQS